MSRFLRIFVLGCIALTFAYLLFHAREPLRLNVGDPGTDATVLSSIKYVEQYGFSDTSFATIADVGPLTEDSYRDRHYPALAQLIYGTVGGYLGISSITTLRLIAIAFSALAMFLLFQYARRIWSDTVALIATMLFTTSLLWMTHADSLNPAPILQASCFLSLWGLVRAIETRQRRHYAAAFLGACACYLAGTGYWLFLPAAAVFTVHAKLGAPFARGHFRFVMLVVGGCAVVVLAKLLVMGGLGLADTSAFDRKLGSPLSTLVRRFTLVFTPMFWVTFVYTAWRAVRAPSLISIVRDGVTWMFVAAALVLYVVAGSAASQMVTSQALLPFYALGSAVLIVRLFDGLQVRPVLAVVWLIAAPLWSFYFMVSHPRSVLDRDDVAKANAYLAANDRNDFVMSNLLADEPIQLAFDRHSWQAPDTGKNAEVPVAMLDAFELTGTDYAHAIIFKTPASRFVDTSLARLAMHRRLWAVTGWPHLLRRKTNGIIRAYDKEVLENLAALNATKVLGLSNFDVYRIDRAAIVEVLGRMIPVVRTIDLGGKTADRHKLVGWSEPLRNEDKVAVSTIDGYFPCPNPPLAHLPGAPSSNACKTLRTDQGIKMMDQGRVERAQLMIRVERACALRVTIELGAPTLVELSIADFTAPQCVPTKRWTFDVPQRAVRAGINVLALETKFSPTESKAEIASVTIDPVCGP